MKPIPSKQVLWSLLDYNPDSGKLTWKPRDEPSFDARFAGKPAFITMEQGYLRGSIYGQLYAAHRVIWVMMTGKEPVGVDHEDGNPSNNRWSNLKEAAQAVNQKNQKLHKTNTSGHAGVTFKKSINKWQAVIGHKNKQILLGSFDNKEDAITARKTAEIDHNYHQNHGRK